MQYVSQELVGSVNSGVRLVVYVIFGLIALFLLIRFFIVLIKMFMSR